MPGSILAVTYDTTAGKYLIQKLGSAQIADLAIVSAHIATDAIGKEHIRDANIVSAALASALISDLGVITDGGVTSSKLASGIVGSVHLADEAVASGDIKANAIATPHILAGGILSAAIGADVIGKEHIRDLNIVSAAIGADEIGKEHIRDANIVSAAIAANAIGGAHIKDGSISESDLASGISIDIAEMAQEPTFRAQVLISGSTPMGIQFSVSGYFSYAQARDISSMPAIGVTPANILSGQVGTFLYGGRLTNTNWNFSGYVGRLLYMGLSSEVTLTAPSASGDSIQRVGKVVDKDTAFLLPELTFLQVAE